MNDMNFIRKSNGVETKIAMQLVNEWREKTMNDLITMSFFIVSFVLFWCFTLFCEKE